MHSFDQSQSENHLDIVMKLIDVNANLNLQDKYGETVLIKATKKNRLDIVKALLHSRADIEICNNSQYTALLMAAEYGHTKIVEELIKAGADLNHEDLDHANTVKKLINAEPSHINHQNNDGRTAMLEKIPKKKVFFYYFGGCLRIIYN